MARKKFRIPGVSFSWKRALGVTGAKRSIARATGVPTTREGRRRKFGPFGLNLLFGGGRSRSSAPVYQPTQTSSASGCAGCLIACGALAVVMFAMCAGMMILGSMVSVRESAVAVAPPADTWKAKNFQDEAIDVDNRSPKTQQARQMLLEGVFSVWTPPENGVVKAELHPHARAGWYADEVARKNFAGMLYAYCFPDNSGTVIVFDGDMLNGDGSQVGTYRWSNGPQYSDIVSEPKHVAVSPIALGETGRDSDESSPEPEIMPVVDSTVAAPERTIEVKKYDVRTWTSSGGGFSVEAEFVSYANGKLKLRKLDGKEITVELVKLSDADKAWIRTKR